MELPAFFRGPPYFFYWLIGLDPGEDVDPTGITLLEHLYGQDHLHADNPAWVRHCDHFRGTYPEQADFVRAFVRHLVAEAFQERLAQVNPRFQRSLIELSRFFIVCDATGPGRGLFDELVKAPLTMNGHTVHVHGVKITGTGTAHHEAPFWYVPHVDLVTSCKIGIQRRFVRGDKAIPGIDALLSEFETLERRQRPSGTVHYGNYREHTHDDMYFALACAWWQLTHGHRVTTTKVLGV